MDALCLLKSWNFSRVARFPANPNRHRPAEHSHWKPRQAKFLLHVSGGARCRLRDRQPHTESCAFAFSLALRFSSASLQANQVLDDRKTQAETAMRSRGTVRLKKAIEHVLKGIGIDTHAGVNDGDVAEVLLARHDDLHDAAFRSEPDGIGQEVPDNLLNPG